MNFKELQKKAEQHWIRGNLSRAYMLYSEMLKLASGKDQKRICNECMSIISEEKRLKNEAMLMNKLIEIMK